MSVMLPSVARGPDTIRAAIRAAVSGRPGPVHVNLPADYIGQPVTYAPLRPAEYGATRSRAVDPESIQKAADLLAKAERPCILAGHGVALSDAAGPLYDLACALQAPVATSPKGKGVFPEDHELSLGVLGFGGQARAEAHIESEIDALLLVGTSMNEFVTNGWVIRPRPETPILQIDVDPLAIGRNYPVAVAVVGDARASLSDLVDRIPRRKPQPAGRAGVSPGSELLRAPSGDDDGRPISPARLVLDLREAIPEDALFFVDTGNSILWATHHFEVRRANTYFIDLGFGAMGSAIAGVVGGAMAAPGRHCIALVGDAAFAMHGFEIHTAVEERLPITWVVMNNGGHGMVHQGDKLLKGRDLGVSLFRNPLDLAALARSLGADGMRAETHAEFRRALGAALRSGRPHVIDVAVDPALTPPTIERRAQTLTRFFAQRGQQPRGSAE